jgi:hypothetical protein
MILTSLPSVFRLAVARIAVAVTVLFLTNGAAHALTINFTQVTGDSLSSGQLAAFDTAAKAWERVLADNVTVNVSIGFKALGSGILGQASTSEVLASYSSLIGQMTGDRTSATDNAAVSHLPGSVGGATSIIVTTAQARALGYTTGAAFDSLIEFNSSFSFAETRNPDGSVGSGLYDLIGIAEHEIGHALGFLSDVGATYLTVLDLFRYQTGSTSLSFATGQAASFSLDGGVTDLASFSTGSDYQASHWLNNSAAGGKNLLMDPAVAGGVVQNIQPLDLIAMDAIGWNVVAVPEPGSMLVLGGALTVLAARRRNRTRA